MLPLHYQRRLPCNDLRLLDIFVKPTSACLMPENHLVGVVERPLGPRRLICQVQEAGIGAPVPGALGVALGRARRAQVAVVMPCGARGEAAGGAPPGLVRTGVETPPSPVEVGTSCSLREPRVDPLGWWVRVVVRCFVFYLITRTRLRWFPPPRVAASRVSSPCLVGIQVGARGRPQPAPSSPLPDW